MGRPYQKGECKGSILNLTAQLMFESQLAFHLSASYRHLHIPTQLCAGLQAGLGGGFAGYSLGEGGSCTDNMEIAG